MKDLLNFSLLVFILFVSSCKDNAKQSIVKGTIVMDSIMNSNSGGALGTSYSILFFADEKTNLKVAIDSVFTEINRSMSTYMPESDISKINKGDSTLVIDHMFKEVFNLAKDIHTRSNGYFDPTVGSLANAWGFGPGEQIKLDSLKVDSLLNYVGFDKVSITDSNTVLKLHPQIQFDFNAIAKGYAIDRLVVMLEKKGYTNFLVELGGEIVTRGKNTKKDKLWVAGIDDPQSTNRSKPKIVITVSNKALASSGNYRKFRIDPETGEKYVHTIDPKTGWTKNSNVLGTSVIANDCATADAYATTFMVMDLEESIALLKKIPNLEAFIVYLDEEGNTQQYVTDGFKKLILH